MRVLTTQQEIVTVITQDFDVRSRRNVPSAASARPGWAKIMQDILALPVPRCGDSPRGMWHAGGGLSCTAYCGDACHGEITSNGA